MADSPAGSPGPGGAETPAQQKARLRRERLAAKSGASRLQQISALQGGPPKDLSEIQKDLPVQPSPAPTPRALSGTATPDPDEVDISQHHYTPASQPRVPSPFAFDSNATGAFPQFPPGQGDSSQDPMMAMLQQMMGAGAGGMPGAQGQPGGPGDLPPGLANMFSAMGGAGEAPDPSPELSSAWIWRLVHSLFSLGLAIYIVLQTPFTGSKLSRNTALTTVDEDWTVENTSAQNFAHFFYLFATFEVIMQSSRYFIEKGQLQGSGILSTVAGFLPPPYGGYVRTIGRYGVIYTTVVSDAMVIVFVLGATVWWRGAGVA
ncbi:hypothetical protein BU25DRAFT_206531 [Macroventuria anomochaeta]|uniref:Uncharacterized protein n=1 Tax=Macroventuria anomochaeta TaxID=301207 RepID=A0ACB6RLC1_9PLEO|nr:uncharacterized protein BU25DRAFT_206531 [Macroventuria anomochaeta]KAF2622593.1 hypothetical protein BU25DRAFT_206531 [Macroventuria anomochaeta]